MFCDRSVQESGTKVPYYSIYEITLSWLGSTRWANVGGRGPAQRGREGENVGIHFSCSDKSIIHYRQVSKFVSSRAPGMDLAQLMMSLPYVLADKYGHYDQDVERMRQNFDPDDPFSSLLAQMRAKVADLYR